MATMNVTQFIAGQVEALLYDKLHELLGVIAQDYDLSHGELVEKYLKYKNEVENPKVIYKATEEVEPDKPKRAPRKAKVTTKVAEDEEPEDDRKGKCEATTAKGLPCKNKAFGGGCFCRVHTKKDEEESKPAKKAAAKKTRGKALEEEAKPEPKKRGRKPKKTQPEHSHPLDEEADDCQLCDTHGNAATGAEQEFEIDEAQLKREALREIMKEELGVEEVTDEMLEELEKNMEKDGEDEMGDLVDKALAELSDEEGEERGEWEADKEREEGEVIEEDLD
jgi:hypothetical protein